MSNYIIDVKPKKRPSRLKVLVLFVLSAILLTPFVVMVIVLIQRHIAEYGR